MKTKLSKTDAISKIRALLFGEEVKCENAKLADGTVIQWDGEFTEGVAVMVISEDGNAMPAPDGTHELEDGTKVTTVGGLVTAIEKKAEEEVEIEVEASEFEKLFTTHLENFTQFTQRLETLESKLAEYETKFTAINETISAAETSTSEKFSKIVELVEAISVEPVAPVEKPANITFKKAKKGTAIEIFQAYQKEINNK